MKNAKQNLMSHAFILSDVVYERREKRTHN